MIDKTTDDFLRVLVIAESASLCKDVDRALWIWPHRVATAVDWAGAIRVSKEFRPAVVCAPLPQSDRDNDLCRHLREQHTDIPIIGYAEDEAERNTLLRAGVVDIAVHPSELSEPSVTGLLEQAIVLCRSRAGGSLGSERHIVAPMRRSRMIGSIVVTAAGVVQCANACVTKWLGYPDASHLVGINFADKHLKRTSDWTALAKVAGDKEALVHAEVSALDVDGRWVAFRAEVSAEPACLMLLRVLFLDETKQQLYQAAAELAYQKAVDSHKAVQ